MEKLTKPELILHLRTYGEEPPKTWTKLELRQRLLDLADAGEITLDDGKRVKTPLQQAVTNLNRASSKKSELVKYVEERLGLMVTPNETIAAIQKKAMQNLLQNIEGSAEDAMGFGKFSSRTYADVAQNEPGYVTWARQTATEGDCSIYLRRFVEWVEKEKGQGTSNDQRKVIVPRPKAHIVRKTKVEKDVGSSSSSSTDQLVRELTGTAAKLAAEIQDLKDQHVEPPRKTPAKGPTKEKHEQDTRSVLQQPGF